MPCRYQPDHHEATASPYHNYDLTEINKFSDTADQWWDRQGHYQVLHHINPLRMAYIYQQCGDLSGKKVLDLGCGGGILSESLARAGAEVTGLDLSEAALSVARQHAILSRLTIDYRHDTVEAHANTYQNHYDVITCMEMLEHVPRPHSVIQACSRLIKPDGHLIFATINRTLKAHLFMIVAAEYVVGCLPIGTHNSHKFIRPSELIRWINQAGLEAKHMVGMSYYPWLHQGKLTGNVDVNYFVSCRKIT